MTILGTGGYIELRKYIDIEGRPGTNHLFMANSKIAPRDCSKEPLTYFRRFIADVRDRTETAMTQQHVLPSAAVGRGAGAGRGRPRSRLD